MKKAGDQYLQKDDPYYQDVLDILKKLPTSLNDQGKPREIKKINPTELQKISVRPDHLLTDQGEFHFRDLSPEDRHFILKVGQIDTSWLTAQDASQLLKLFHNLEIPPEQIARSPEQINDQTKAYVGPLGKDAFFKIQQYHIDHIYTSFPEGRISIERNFEAGPLTFEEFKKMADQYNQTITDPSKKIQYSDYAKDMMKNESFATLEKSEQLDLVRLRVNDLFNDNKAHTTKEIYQKAQELGLELCPPEIGPLKRLQDIDQPLNEWYWIAMKQIPGRSGDPSVFSLVLNANGLWLNNDWTEPDDRWDPENEIVFCLRPRTKAKLGAGQAS